MLAWTEEPPYRWGETSPAPHR